MSLRCHWLWGHIVRFEAVLWRCGGPKYYSVLQSTTLLLQYFYKSTTRVRLCTAQYYSSTTLYYKVLLQYCACHAKWISWLIRVTCETSFPTRGASKVTFQTRQVLRRDFEFKISARNPWIASANYKDDSRIIRAWSEDKIGISHPPLRRPYSSDLGDDFVLKNATFHAPATSQNVTTCCACHVRNSEVSHPNFVW